MQGEKHELISAAVIYDDGHHVPADVVADTDQYGAASGKELGGAMLEISARTDELPNGAVIDNADALAYARLYREALAH